MDNFEQRIIELKESQKQGFLHSYEHPPVDMTDFPDLIMSCDRADIKYRHNLDMYEIHRLEKYSWTPTFLLNLLEMCNQTSLLKNSNIIGFIQESSGSGYGWHDDLFDIVITNVCGTTTWEFEDGTSQLMKPFDVMYVPKGVRHTVTSHSPRFTASIGCNLVPD